LLMREVRKWLQFRRRNGRLNGSWIQPSRIHGWQSFLRLN
jgi:hypothetical protein